MPSVSYVYNDSYLIKSLYNTKTNQGDISLFTYVHDQVGNRLSVTGSWGTQTYSYDNIYQVTGVDYPEGYPFGDKTYNYDPVGNRDSTVNGGTVDYQNNELNEYTTVGGTPFASDLRGNLTTDGTHVYQYDLENRLIAIDEDISYTYNPFGLRTGKTVGGTSTQYILDDQREIEEWEGGALQRKFIYGVGIDEPLVMETGGSRYYYHFDALGSVHNLTDSTGSTAATYRYDIYGAFNIAGISHGNPYTFTGRRYDSESGLYYYRARHYNDQIGSFIQRDPPGYDSNSNIYAYVKNNPLNIIDPSGKDSEEMGWVYKCQSMLGAEIENKSDELKCGKPVGGCDYNPGLSEPNGTCSDDGSDIHIEFGCWDEGAIQHTIEHEVAHAIKICYAGPHSGGCDEEYLCREIFVTFYSTECDDEPDLKQCVIDNVIERNCSTCGKLAPKQCEEYVNSNYDKCRSK